MAIRTNNFCENTICDLHIPHKGGNWCEVLGFWFDRAPGKDKKYYCNKCRNSDLKEYVDFNRLGT